MSLEILWKATRLTLGIVGLSVVHSFSVGEWTIADNALEAERSIWLANGQLANGQLANGQLANHSINPQLSQFVAITTVAAR